MARKKQLIPIKNSSELSRDISSKAIVNTNISAYNLHLNRKNREKSQAAEIASLKSDVAELKALVQSLLAK